MGWSNFWLGKTLNASPEATSTEFLFMFVLWVNIISFAVVMGVMFYFVFKYRRGAQKTNYQVSVAHNTPLELAWSIIPLIVMVPIFWWGFKGYVGKLASPSDSEEIMIRGYQWSWDITYANGAVPLPTSEEWKPRALTLSGDTNPVFAVPAGRPVRFMMSSSDVIHAFYIPDFRTKMDVFPNRYTSMWFKPQELKDGETAREHRVFCAEYCGQDHSEMAAVIRVIPQKDYEELIRLWTEPPGDWTPRDIGKFIFQSKCSSCHTIDGKPSTGPTWKNLYMSKVELASGGEPVTADENYIRESILVPSAKIHKGFQPQMPSFQGQIKPKQLDALILYIKSLSDKATDAEKAAAEQVPDQSKGAPAGAEKK